MAKEKKKTDKEYDEKLKIEGTFEDLIGVSVKVDMLKSITFTHGDRKLKVVYKVTKKETDPDRITFLTIDVSHNYTNVPELRNAFSFTYDANANVLQGYNNLTEEEVADLILENEGFL